MNKIQNNNVYIESDLDKLDKELEENSDSYIPTTIRDALESAGINIEEIINMKNQLEMSLGSSSINLGSRTPIKTTTTTTTTATKKATKAETSAQLGGDIDSIAMNVSGGDASNRESTTTTSASVETDGDPNRMSPKSNQLVSMSSNLKAIDIKQNMSAQVSEQVENVNTTAAAATATAAAAAIAANRRSNGRKKSSATSQNRYATVRFFNF